MRLGRDLVKNKIWPVNIYIKILLRADFWKDKLVCSDVSLNHVSEAPFVCRII